MFVVSAIVFFIVPMLIVTVLYILIAIELRRSSKMNNAISKQTSSHLQHAHIGCQSRNQHLANQTNELKQKQEQQLCRRKAPTLVYCYAAEEPTQRPAKLSGERPLLAGAASPSSSLEVARARQLASGRSHAEPATESLMTSLMSQRPSSAIGTERPGLARGGAASGGHQEAERGQLASSLSRLQATESSLAGKRAGLSLWPFSWTSQTQAQQLQCQCHCHCHCHCHCLHAHHLQQAARGASLALQQSQSNQLLAASGADCSAGAAAAAARQRSPLSYHESLIQRQANGTGQLKQQHSKLRPFVAQLSLSSSTPSYQCRPVRGFGPLCCQHQALAAASQRGAQSRRLAGASSKKSVIRMLGK